MSKHISYFLLKKNHKGFKKGSKTNIRNKIGGFFEITKNNGTQIKFREDKWNEDLFEPLYFNININTLKNELISECNSLIEFSFEKQLDKFGLKLWITLSWNWEAYYEIGDVYVYPDKKFYKTKLEKEIGVMLQEDLQQNYMLLEDIMKEEIKMCNKNLNIFLNKCHQISKEVGFDVYESFLK